MADTQIKHKIENNVSAPEKSEKEGVDVEKVGRAAEKGAEVNVAVEQPKEALKQEEQVAGGAVTGIAAMRKTQEQKQREKEIENILAKNLEDIFINMPSDKQQEFKKAGEETSRKINEILNSAKVKVNKIISLIKKWLSIIPGVNKFFLEQEAKIKSDEIVKLKSEL